MNSVSYKNQKIQPSKIICIGRNYAAHIEELNNETPTEPVIFLKPNSAISNELNIDASEKIHYESEISFLVIDRKLSGVGFGLDLTKREIQSTLKAKGLPWERAKAFDGSAVFSKFVAINRVKGELRLELTINGELIQQGGVSLMLNKPSDLMAEAESFLSFENGDILMTGTPSGVGIVNQGDVFVGSVFDGRDCLVEQSWIAK